LRRASRAHQDFFAADAGQVSPETIVEWHHVSLGLLNVQVKVIRQCPKYGLALLAFRNIEPRIERKQKLKMRAGEIGRIRRQQRGFIATIADTTMKKAIMSDIHYFCATGSYR
jgi:hypothetical protein